MNRTLQGDREQQLLFTPSPSATASPSSPASPSSSPLGSSATITYPIPPLDILSTEDQPTLRHLPDRTSLSPLPLVRTLLLPLLLQRRRFPTSHYTLARRAARCDSSRFVSPSCALEVRCHLASTESSRSVGRERSETLESLGGCSGEGGEEGWELGVGRLGRGSGQGSNHV